MTRREEIERILEKEPSSIFHLAHYFGCEIKDILEDLEHIKRSVKSPKKFKFIPAYCKNCGFQFKERSRVKPPTKCPKCRSESIVNPLFKIE